jgi:Periplasmic copper-binding protein (NosD)
MSRIKTLMFVLALAVQVPLASAKTITYTVGSCNPKSYPTIQEALDATPSPNVVKVCPGTYPEQIKITFPVTLEGISSGNATGATIAVPPGGLVVGSNNFAAQVFVQSSGEVNLSNLTIDGTGNNVPAGVYIAGVFYLGSPGTMNHLTVQNQNGNYLGVGIYLLGTAANPSVTVENSNVQGFEYVGIWAAADPPDSPLSATIKGNYTYPSGSCAACASIGIAAYGATASINGNVVTGGNDGVVPNNGGEVSVSKNTVLGAYNGIWVLNDFTGGSVTLTSNLVYDSQLGIYLVPGESIATVTGNTIVQARQNAIFFSTLAGGNLHSNTILGTALGLACVTDEEVKANTYYNVGTISSDSGC